MKDMLLSLADELEGMDVREGCRTCPADGTKDCRGDLSCEEAVARAVARRVREILEHDECEVTTVSAYDLLPDEDCKAIAWVREHGGLEAVEKRLMPEGMEWPRFDDDAPIKFGDEFADGLGNTRKCQSVELLGGDDGVCDAAIRWGEHDDEFLLVCVWQGEHVKRPAPKVLDADGAEIKRGDTVWPTENPKDGYVLGGEVLTMARADGGRIRVDFLDESGNISTYYASELTHRAPVLAADGKPLRVGETVWDIETGEEFHVTGFDDGYVITDSKTFGDTPMTPSALTHEQPDTWERIEEDCAKFCIEYCDEHGLLDHGCNAAEGDASTRHCTDCGDSCEERMARDLVRRCRALAERDA